MESNPCSAKEAPPPFIPRSRAVSMRSVQTAVSARAPEGRATPVGLATRALVTGSCLFLRPGGGASTFLHPFAPRALPRFNATMGALTPVRHSSPHRSPCFTCTAFQTIPSPTTLCRPVVALARYPSARQVSRLHTVSAGQGFALNSQARRDTRPNRVRHPTDWSFTSCCCPPRLTATQLRSVTGWKAFCLEGTLTPLTMHAHRRTSPAFRRSSSRGAPARHQDRLKAGLQTQDRLKAGLQTSRLLDQGT